MRQRVGRTSTKFSMGGHNQEVGGRVEWLRGGCCRVPP